MGKNIIIAEKHSVGEDYARVLGVVDENNKGYKENDTWIVTWTQGHLVEMDYPEKYSEELKEWKLETLPFLPDNFKYSVKNDVKFQFNIVKKLYNRSDIDTIYYAGDSGREGLYIQMLVRQLAGHKSGVNERVVWINSQTDDEILRGINEAKDISEYKDMSDSGYVRAIDDYLIGINYSRLLTKLYGNMVNSGSSQKRMKPISVGRVMSCVLAMIVEKERAIRNFKPTAFYRLNASIDNDNSKIDLGWTCVEGSKMYNSPKLYSEVGFNKESDAKEFMDSLGKKGIIENVENNEEKKFAPLLFNLTELQSECTKKFHMSPSETLACAQKLYESKMISYPRTSSRYLTQAVASEIGRNIEKLSKGTYGDLVNSIVNNNWSIKSKYIDDTKVEDHYALIPTGNYKGALSEKESNVYDTIVRRFLAIFYPAAEYNKIKIKMNVNGEIFNGTAKYLNSPGFYDVLGLPNEDETSKETVEAMCKLSRGNTYDIEYSLKKGETVAPKRYTTGSLVLAMENAGNLIEDDELREQIKANGIGTSATRDEIVNKLITLNYVYVNDKTQIITPTNLGEMIYEILNMTIPYLLRPENTAEEERRLDAIAKGEFNKESYLKNVYDSIRTVCEKVKNSSRTDEVYKKIRPFASGRILEEIKPFESWNTKLICPVCGDEIETMSWGFKCKSNKGKNEGCTFSIGDILGHRLLTNELGLLLTKGKCGPIYDFISQKGKPFAAYLLWDKQTQKISFEMTEFPWNKTDLKCPICNNSIVERDGFYKCEKYIDKETGCKFFIGKIAGKKLTIKHIEKLVKEGQTELISGFKNKVGNKFDAFLVWNKNDNNVSFKFPNNADLETDMKCPICSGKILNTSMGFRCENYKPLSVRKENDCTFFIGDFLGHKIKSSELKVIVSGGNTEPVKLKNKDKKDFEARLFWNKEEQKINLKFDDNNPVDMGAKCPICGGRVLKNKFGYYCENRKSKDEGCQFYIGTIANVLIDDIQLKKLATNGKTDLINGFKSKNKNVFSAYLVWNKETNSVEFEFQDAKSSRTKSDYTCPVCRRNKMYETDYNYYCECGFKLGKTFASKEIPKEQIMKLCTVGKTDIIPGFFSAKKRKMYAAKLYIADGKLQMEIPTNKEIIKSTKEITDES